MAEKAAELGASRLTVVATERTQSFRARDGLLPRLERIVREAAKQAGAARFTSVAGPVAFAEALSADASARLLVDPSGEAFPARLPAGTAALLVGPEGGFTDAERAAARESGWLTVALPAGVVRAETAAVAAIVLARAALSRPKA
jgi:16S rRNA (uracil1498-N3)-methyltransferase